MSDYKSAPQGADAINALRDLADRGRGDFKIVALPKEMIPAGATVKAPHVAITTPPTGEPKIVSLKPFIDEIRGKPARIIGTATVTTLDSFVGLVNRHKAANSAIFVDANWQAPKLSAVIDYHGESTPKTNVDDAVTYADDEPGDDPRARFGSHRIGYAFPLSEPWRQWLADDLKTRLAKGKGLMSQAEFAAFLEDHIHEISSPMQSETVDIETRFKTRPASAGEMLTLSRGLEVHVESAVKSKQKLQSGESQIVFETTHKDAGGGEIDVPGMFVVEIPLFYEGDTIRLYVRLRYRPTSNGIQWGYELFRPDITVDDAVRNAVQHVANETGLPCFDGSPEA